MSEHAGDFLGNPANQSLLPFQIIQPLHQIPTQTGFCHLATSQGELAWQKLVLGTNMELNRRLEDLRSIESFLPGARLLSVNFTPFSNLGHQVQLSCNVKATSVLIGFQKAQDVGMIQVR